MVRSITSKNLKQKALFKVNNLSFLSGIFNLNSYRSKEKETLDIQPDLSTVFDEINETFHLFDLRDVKMLLSPTKVCDSKFVVIAPSAPKNQKLRSGLKDSLRMKHSFYSSLLDQVSKKEILY